MGRLPLQDCQRCGSRHYGPATATNCPKFSSGGGSSMVAVASSSLATKSVLSVRRTPDSREPELDADQDIDDLIGVDASGIHVVGDGSIRQNRADPPPEQGSFGDPEDFLEAMSGEGHDGWRAINPPGYEDARLSKHPSEVIGVGWGMKIKAEPGRYAAVSLYDYDGDENTGWMLLKKDTPRSSERGVGGSSDPEERKKIASGIASRLRADGVMDKDPDHMHLLGRNREHLEQAEKELDRIPEMAANGDTRGLMNVQLKAHDQLGKHIQQLQTVMGDLHNSNTAAGLRRAIADHEARYGKRGGPEGSDAAIREAEEELRHQYGYGSYAEAAREQEATMKRRHQMEDSFRRELKVLRGRQMQRNGAAVLNAQPRI